MTFSYNPENLAEFGLDRMRFELGDVMVAEPDKNAYLCDEEYLAVIASSSSWLRAKIRLVETLLMRFGYEVTTEVKNAKWQLSDRVDFWKDLHKRLKTELEEEESAAAFGFAGTQQRPPIFRIGMHDYRGAR